MENPPTKKAVADPWTCLASLNQAWMEIGISDFVSFVFGIKWTKCSGEYGKKMQYELPVSRSNHGFAYLHCRKRRKKKKNTKRWCYFLYIQPNISRNWNINIVTYPTKEGSTLQSYAIPPEFPKAPDLLLWASLCLQINRRNNIMNKMPPKIIRGKKKKKKIISSDKSSYHMNHNDDADNGSTLSSKGQVNLLE